MRHLSQRMPRLDMQRLVAPLERPPSLTAETIETRRPRRLQPAHPLAQVRLRRFHRQVKVIPHDDEGVHPPAKPLRRLEQAPLERLRRPLPHKQIAPVIAAIDHVITRPRELQPQLPCHAPPGRATDLLVKSQSMTPSARPMTPSAPTGPQRLQERREDADGVTAARRWRDVCRMFIEDVANAAPRSSCQESRPDVFRSAQVYALDSSCIHCSFSTARNFAT